MKQDVSVHNVSDNRVFVYCNACLTRQHCQNILFAEISKLSVAPFNYKILLSFSGNQTDLNMSWIRDTKDKRSWLQQFCANVLKSGSVPKHVAFIMDGNRRYAKKNSMDRAEGHLMGFDKLAQVRCCTNAGRILSQ